MRYVRAMRISISRGYGKDFLFFIIIYVFLPHIRGKQIK